MAAPDKQRIADIIMAKTVWQGREGGSLAITSADREDWEYQFCMDAADAIVDLIAKEAQ